MQRLNRWLVLLLASLVVASVTADVSHEITADETATAENPPEKPAQESVDQLVSKLESFQQLSADFSQRESQSGSPQKGRVWISRPNQFRIEMAPPLSQTIVSDGETLWTWDRDLEQVIISQLGSDVAEVPILLFSGDPVTVAAGFDVQHFTHKDLLGRLAKAAGPDSPESAVDNKSLVIFSLKPKAESILEDISLEFHGDMPSRIGIQTNMGQQTEIDLYNVMPEAADPDLFTFAIPEFADVIDDRP